MRPHSLPRLPTGVPGFDELVEGGLLPSRAYLVVGPPGSGKTTFGMQFLLEGVRRGEMAAYVSLLHDPMQTLVDIERFDPNVRAYVNSGMLTMVDLGQELWTGKIVVPQWGNVLLEIKDIIQEKGIKRLVVDPLTAIEFPTQNPVDKRAKLASFIRTITDLGVTVLFIAEMTQLDRYTDEYYLADGIIMLHYYLEGRDMVRAIQVLKMRGTDHETKMHRLEFTSKGLVVRGPLI